MSGEQGEAFPEAVVDEAWGRAAGGDQQSEWSYCECDRASHANHRGKVPCGALLVKENRGRQGIGCWEANHRVRRESGAKGILSNCEILCWNCHKLTF